MKWKKTTQQDVNMPNVESINNEYTETQVLKKKISQAMNQKLKRRMISIVTIGAVILIPMAKGVVDNLGTIQEMEMQIAIAKEDKKSLTQENQDLEIQVGLLQDEEYVAKLARSRYYLSKDGEIIFSLPEDNRSKAAEKE